MHRLTFFPIGNADCCRIDLANGKKLLFDFAHLKVAEEASDRRIDLAKVLRDDLVEAKRSHFDLVAFTHLDDDHYHGATEFFHLEHSKAHQGGNRIQMHEMWVPAFVITENSKDLQDEAKLIQAEARHRLRAKKGIRVFSRPAALSEWLATEKMTLSDVSHLLTDAGQIAPGFGVASDGVEFFVHSPFASRQNDGSFVDRNSNSLVFQATFSVEGVTTRIVLSADSTHEVLTEMVAITRAHGRENRLLWDVFKLPHHCSYKSLSETRGKDETSPVPDVAWLFEKQAATGGVVISPSNPIPARDSEDDDNQPPHRQAAAYQRRIAASRSGSFLVTMEHPTESAPEPIVIEIDRLKATVRKRALGSAYITSRPAPRAGGR